MSSLTTQATINDQIFDGFVSDIRNQPNWRADAAVSAAYYDGKQITAEMRQTMQERGQPVIVHNLIAPAIDGILGFEARTRAQPRLVADDDNGLPVVEALQQKMSDAARLSTIDKICSDAYAAQIKTGLGWVEITKESDPFKFPYAANYIHRDEIWWDWRSKRSDLEDCRWLMRRRWIDKDTAVAHFPNKKEVFNWMGSGWQGFDMWGEMQHLNYVNDLVDAYQSFTASTQKYSEYWNSDRKMVLLNEVYYRVWDRKPVIRTPKGDVAIYDPRNTLHVSLVAAGAVQVEVRSFTRMRLAYFAGPHKLADIESPHPHNYFPYIPFFGYREDDTGIPYGLVRRMIPAQDEVNFRRSKLTQLLNLKRVIKDNDALLNMSNEQMMDEIYKVDGVINLNPMRKNANGFQIQTDSGIASQQFQVLESSQRLIQDVAGVYSSFLGQDSGAKSGVAINSLVNQGVVTLGELNDNYRFARQRCYELLLANIVSDIGSEEMEVRVNVNSPKKSRTIVLNEQNADGQINNSVMKTKLAVVISEVGETAGYRQQVNMAIGNLMQKLPPEFMPAMIEMFVETADIDNRDEILAQVRKLSGSTDAADLTPEEQEALVAKKAEEEKARALEFQAMVERVNNDAAEAKRKLAEANRIEKMTDLDAEEKATQIGKLRAQIKEIITNTVKTRRDMERIVIEDTQRLSSQMVPASNAA